MSQMIPQDNLDDQVKKFAQELEAVQFDPDIHDFLTQVVNPLNIQRDENVVRFSLPEGGFGVIISLVSYVLFRWAKDTLDHRRSLLNVVIVKQHIQIVQDLVDSDWPRDIAEPLVEHCFDAIYKRDKDDPVIKKLLAIAVKFVAPHDPTLLDESNANDRTQ